MQCQKCKTELADGSKFCHICGNPVSGKPRPSGRRRGNGEGSAYKRGRTWEVAVVLGYYLDENGKAKPKRRTKGGFKTKKEALAYAPQLRQERHRTVPTLGDLWQQFQAGKYKKLTPSRQESHRIAWKKLGDLEFTRIDQLTTADLQAAVDKAATFYPARDIRDLLSILYQLAMPDQFVSTNLAKFVTLPDLNAKQQEAFTAEEIGKLWSHYGSGNWWTGYILLMCYTGMMPGELLTARKDMVDLKAKTITGAGKKTKERKAVPIVLADVIVPVVDDLMQHTQGDKLIRINKDNFYKVFYQALEDAGCRRLPPYTCRHTAATALAESNIPPSVIQKIMRHSSFQTTTRYIHIGTDPMLDAVNKLKLPTNASSTQS